MVRTAKQRHQNGSSSKTPRMIRTITHTVYQQTRRPAQRDGILAAKTPLTTIWVSADTASIRLAGPRYLNRLLDATWVIKDFRTSKE